MGSMTKRIRRDVAENMKLKTRRRVRRTRQRLLRKAAQVLGYDAARKILTQAVEDGEV